MIKPIELESADGNAMWNTLTATGAGDARFRKRRPMNAARLQVAISQISHHTASVATMMTITRMPSSSQPRVEPPDVPRLHELC
jgi:hypothetical protein